MVCSFWQLLERWVVSTQTVLCSWNVAKAWQHQAAERRHHICECFGYWCWSLVATAATNAAPRPLPSSASNRRHCKQRVNGPHRQCLECWSKGLWWRYDICILILNTILLLTLLLLPGYVVPLQSSSGTCYGREPPGISGMGYFMSHMSFLSPTHQCQIVNALKET